jgi:hypothetical protein
MNVYNNENDRQKYLDRYFTEEGVKALENRLEHLARLYIEEQKYPFTAQMLGFVHLKIQSRAHHEGMMENLRQILGLKEIILKGGN